MATVFTSRQAIQITGVTQRQLAYWRKIGLITPSRQTPGGHSRYTFPDLIALKTAKRLIDAGISLQKLRRTITALTTTLPHLQQPLTELSLLATGDVILVFHEGAVFETLTGQEWILPIAQFQREIEQQQSRQRAGASGQGELFPETKSA